MGWTIKVLFWLGLLGVGWFYVWPQFKLLVWNIQATFEPIVWNVTKALSL